jgi:hypothetical protein
LIAALLVLAACDGKPDPGSDDTGPVGQDTDVDTDTDTDSDTDADTDTDTDTDACTAVVTSISPADGELGVALDSPIVAEFSEPVTVADINLDNGVTGVVTVGSDGTFATFVPRDDLDEGVTYTASVEVCRVVTTSSFTTVGGELDVDLTDRAYDVALDGSDITWVHPTFGSLLVGQLETTSLLFMVQSADSSQIDMVAAAGYQHRGATTQYPCTYAVDFDPTAFTSRPMFEAGPLDTTMVAAGVSFDVYDLAFSGNFEADYESAWYVEVTGLLDVTPLGYDICGLADSFGDPCVACPDGEEHCLLFDVIDASSPYVDGLWIDKDLDPTTDSSCN